MNAVKLTPFLSSSPWGWLQECTTWYNFDGPDVFGILLPKLFWPTARKNCSSDWEKLLKFEPVGWEFSKILRSLEQFVQTVKGQKFFGNRMLF